MKTIHSIAPLAVLLFAVTGASAQTDIGPFPIDGLQQVPPNASPGTGTGSVTLQPGGMLDFNIVFSGLLGTEVAAHFHGPADFGENASVQFPLPLGSPKIGSVGPLNAQQQSDLLDGLWYVNIHSNQFPGGEIRGQVVPAPDTGGVNFFLNADEFELAVSKAGKVLKGVEEYPWSAGPGSVLGVDDPLDVNTSVPGWIQPGILLDNITYQSNLDPFGANGPNPRGGTGLALFTTGFIGATHNGLVANHFVDSLDILSGPPAGDNHTAMAMQVVSFNNSPGGSAVTVSVYNKDDKLIGTLEDISAPANQGGAFVGLLVKGEDTIGRVNLYDTNPGFDAEGLYQLAVYVADEPDPCPWDLDGGGDVGVGDLLILLANWNNPYGVPDLLRMLAAWGPCP